MKRGVQEKLPSKIPVLLGLINNQPDIDKIYSYTKNPYEDKYQFLINKKGSIELKQFNNTKALIEYSNNMQDVYKNICEYNSGRKHKTFIIFDDMIADIIENKNLNSIVTELFIWGRKFNISYAFITKWYFKVLKDVWLNSTHFLIMKIPNKKELQQVALNYSSDIDFKELIKI